MTIYTEKPGIFRTKDNMLEDIFGENYMVDGKVDRKDSQLKKEADIETQNFLRDYCP